MKIIREDPAVDNVTGFTGGSRVNSGMMFITLKPRDQRHETAQQVIDRLRKKLANEPGANLFLMAVQDIRVGGRQSNASYQYTLLSDDLSALREWGAEDPQSAGGAAGAGGRQLRSAGQWRRNGPGL